MANSLIRGPEDIPALQDIGLIFGGLALFWVVFALVDGTGILVVFFSFWGFLIGGCYGDCHSPASADRLLAAQQHLRAVATGCAVGVLIGAGVALALILIFAAWRPGGSQAKAKAAAIALPPPLPSAQEQAILEEFDKGIREVFPPPPPRLLLSHFKVQQFLRKATNRN